MAGVPAGLHDFGRAADGKIVRRATIRGGGLTASVMSWGAGLQDLRLEGHPAPLVLGFDTFAPYLDHSPYFGVTVGRYANRIAGGLFSIDGEKYAAEVHDAGGSCLHGGSVGTGQRNWTIAELAADRVQLTLHDPDGFMGFPGAVDMAVSYSVTSQGWLAIEMTATADAPTLCNLAHHSYFNLDDGGETSIADHRMMIAAGAYTPVDHRLIPTGAVMPVEGTAFDFVIPRPIGTAMAYDHNFCLAAARGPLRQAAWVQGGQSGIEMEVWTTEPGLQVYTGSTTAVPVPGLGGRHYVRNAGVCLEPQVWPDSPNRPWFPQAVLRPGETYRQVTQYRFRPPAVA